MEDNRGTHAHTYTHTCVTDDDDMYNLEYWTLQQKLKCKSVKVNTEMEQLTSGQTKAANCDIKTWNRESTVV